MKVGIGEQNFHREIKGFHNWSRLEQLRIKMLSQRSDIKSHSNRRISMAFEWLKAEFPIATICQWIRGEIVKFFRGNIVRHGRFLSLNWVGIGCVRAGECLRTCQPAPFCGRHYRRRIFACQRFMVRHYSFAGMLEFGP